MSHVSSQSLDISRLLLSYFNLATESPGPCFTVSCAEQTIADNRVQEVYKYQLRCSFLSPSPAISSAETDVRKAQFGDLLMSALSISAGLYHNEYITETFCSVLRLRQESYEN